MPEGDTLFIAARRVGAVLTGRVVTRFESPLPELKERDVEGHVVKAVRAQGKYLIIELDDERAFLSHLRMQGKWFASEKSSMREQLLAKTARDVKWDDENTTLIIETADSVAVLSRAAVAVLAPLSEIERRVASLGPDLLSPDYDPAEALSRLREHPETTIAEALMLQSIVAGIGNVYKSEILFIEKVSPFVLVGALDDATLERLLKRGKELMRRNLKGPRRTTFGNLGGPNYFVYDRSGQRCMKCDTKIRMRRQGNLQRSTYYCPECQGVVDG
ncbi:MAG TPA: DNA-formamidopyrimidine glycosylase family protein [Polyangiaceae bacterium]|nr:DNA-formamidopyrimidine glycosylase family protein [Polyangiaceae bacterium]